MSISKGRRARVWVAGAWGETHIHRGFPSMNPSLERCGEVGIEEDGGPHSVLVLDVLYDVPNLVEILAAHLRLYLLSERLADAVLT